MTSMERASLVLKTVVSVGVMLSMCAGLWAALNQVAQAAQKAEVARLDAEDAKMESRITKLVEVVEVNSTLMVEPRGSADYVIAVARLRALRRVVHE